MDGNETVVSFLLRLKSRGDLGHYICMLILINLFCLFVVMHIYECELYDPFIISVY